MNKHDNKDYEEKSIYPWSHEAKEKKGMKEEDE
jgi:hypothetical protein